MAASPKQFFDFTLPSWFDGLGCYEQMSKKDAEDLFGSIEIGKQSFDEGSNMVRVIKGFLSGNRVIVSCRQLTND